MSVGVLLMTFGSAVTESDVPQYLRSVRHGAEPSEELVAEFRRRFRLIGKSPLIQITREQGAALETLLAQRHGEGSFKVSIGMLHLEPSIPAAVKDLVDQGCPRIIAVVLAPQYSPLVLKGYESTLKDVRAANPNLQIDVCEGWHDLEAWLSSLLERIDAARSNLPADTPIIFTAHSLPKSVVDNDPAYVEKLQETAKTLAARLELRPQQHYFAWQSAGHSPGEWLKPDLAEVMVNVARDGHSNVLVVPVQFVAEHLETLYDIDIAARDQASEAGIELRRIAMPNSSERLVEALADAVERTIANALTAPSRT